jgi:hypothetical protein
MIKTYKLNYYYTLQVEANSEDEAIQQAEKITKKEISFYDLAVEVEEIKGE